MELFLIGHSYKYAAEQILLCLYPAERPVYPASPSGGDSAVLTLRRGKRWAVFRCALRLDGAVSRGSARVALSALTDPIAEDRLLQRALKLAFYRAALAAGHEVPPWGSLTGVRPGKLFSSQLRQGMSETRAARYFEKSLGVSPERTALCRSAVRAAGAAEASLAPGDVCLYVGIPFCPSRCAYCSFVSVEAPRSLGLIPVYLDALEKELGALAAAVKEAELRVVSVYIGGGTPTTLSAEELERLCTRLCALFDLSACREFSVEAGRPDTVTVEKLRALARCGVTRVNVNPQTMSDAVLETIGRRHSAADILRAVEQVRSLDCFELNMDLIAGLPGDSPAQFRATLDTVLALRPENLTIHTLALKKGSRFLTEGTPIPDGADVSLMLNDAASLLPAAGYMPYYLYRQKFMAGAFENVGWTLPGHENLYNICIMEELCGILAAGAGSSTKLTGPGGALQRIMDPKYPREYMERIDAVCAAKAQIPDFYRSHRSELQE